MRRILRNLSKSQPKAGMQLPLNIEERIEMLQEGLTKLSFRLGLEVAQDMMAAEMKKLCGSEYSRRSCKIARRWGQQGGMVTLAGQKYRLQRPRARFFSGQEVRLKTYEHLQKPEAMPESTLRLLLRGVSCRDYAGALEEVAEGFGAKKSSVSRHFVRASQKKLREFGARRFEGQRFVAVFIDGVNYGGETLVVALGVMEKGDKIVLGLRQGATENAEVCKNLLEELRERGLDLKTSTLFVLDGSKALAAAVKAVWGDLAVVQRCQVHKVRNVLSYLAEKYHPYIRRSMAKAYRCGDYHEAKQKLLNLVAWLSRINRDAAASLREGLEETLTVLKLGLTPLLTKSLCSTNPIESAFSTTAKLTRRVKRWRNGDMRLRWACTGLLRAEARFKRLKGYRDIPKLIEALKAEGAGNNTLDCVASAA